jgi:uncharacterized protein (DUF924 family)
MAGASLVTPDEVLDFWFDAGPQKWFSRDAAFDAAITERFLPTHEAAAAGKLADWEQSAEGALALLILLDQFPRNMFRASARAFVTDSAALAIAKRAVARGFDRELDLPKRNFFYMPFMHSEDLADQERCVELSRAYSDANTLKWAELHADIIRRFGRFPHRNALLGRATTLEEKAFLDAGGFAG